MASVSSGARMCNKLKNDRKGLVPGIFVMHCLRCASCIGFHVMDDAESPRTLFEAIMTRWETAPHVVVYDNACHAHAYFLNREPEYARDMVCLVDTLHYKGHTGCSQSYDISIYPQWGRFNSQLCEQKVRCWPCMVYLVR